MIDEKTRKFRRPDAQLLGADGNIFVLLGIASRTLKRHGYPDKADEMFNRATQTKSYEAAIAVILEYVNPVKVEAPHGAFFIEGDHQ